MRTFRFAGYPRPIATSPGPDRRWRTSLASCRSAGIVVKQKRSSVPKFDQRRFHDAILAIRSVPLPVLEQRMAQFNRGLRRESAGDAAA